VSAHLPRGGRAAHPEGARARPIGFVALLFAALILRSPTSGRPSPRAHALRDPPRRRSCSAHARRRRGPRDARRPRHVWSSAYQRARFLAFSIFSDPRRPATRLAQASLGLGRGAFGRGLARGSRRSTHLRSATGHDLRGHGEELGLVGVTRVVLGRTRPFGLRGFRVALACKIRSESGAAGLTTLVCARQSSTWRPVAPTAIAPLTGIPLPFISYGGTNLHRSRSRAWATPLTSAVVRDANNPAPVPHPAGGTRARRPALAVAEAAAARRGWRSASRGRPAGSRPARPRAGLRIDASRCPVPPRLGSFLRHARERGARRSLPADLARARRPDVVPAPALCRRADGALRPDAPPSGGADRAPMRIRGWRTRLGRRLVSPRRASSRSLRRGKREPEYVVTAPAVSRRARRGGPDRTRGRSSPARANRPRRCWSSREPGAHSLNELVREPPRRGAGRRPHPAT